MKDVKVRTIPGCTIQAKCMDCDRLMTGVLGVRLLKEGGVFKGIAVSVCGEAGAHDIARVRLDDLTQDKIPAYIREWEGPYPHSKTPKSEF